MHMHTPAQAQSHAHAGTHCRGRRCMHLRVFTCRPTPAPAPTETPQAWQPTRGIGLAGASRGSVGARKTAGVAWGTSNDVGLQSLGHALQHGRVVGVVEEAGVAEQVRDGHEGVACRNRIGDTPSMWLSATVCTAHAQCTCGGSAHAAAVHMRRHCTCGGTAHAAALHMLAAALGLRAKGSVQPAAHPCMHAHTHLRASRCWPR